MLAIDLSSIFEFSRQHCVAICSFLVPTTLLATLQTLILLFWQRPQFQVNLAGVVASCFAAIIILHVGTWLEIGVLTPVSFVLLALGTVCLVVNRVAIASPEIATRFRLLWQDNY